jgi:SAM-dependent methyltransferase
MCAGTELERVVSLRPTPDGNKFLRPDQLSLPEPRYPLDLYFCDNCHHVQLGHVVDPRILYQQSYPYVTGTSAKFVEHLRLYASEMIASYSLKAGALVADIGSNDGTCLRFFADAGLRVLGVDPATEIAERATASGIPTLPRFFSYDLAVRLRDEHGPASLITSHNALAHIDDLDDVLRGVRHWLADDGLFVCEVGYLLDVVENAWFDTIYHEHLDYHTVGPFRQLFARVDLQPIAAQRISPQGGSIRIFGQPKGGPHQPDRSVADLVALEHQRRLDTPETLVDFGRRIDRVGSELRSLLTSLRSKGKSIAGYGAPTKATTLLCHFELGPELDFLVDDNPLKQGLFSPATHLAVLGPSALYERRPDFVLILAWNFADPIMAAHRQYAAEGGRFILPMPEPRIVST